MSKALFCFGLLLSSVSASAGPVEEFIREHLRPLLAGREGLYAITMREGDPGVIRLQSTSAGRRLGLYDIYLHQGTNQLPNQAPILNLKWNTNGPRYAQIEGRLDLPSHPSGDPKDQIRSLLRMDFLLHPLLTPPGRSAKLDPLQNDIVDQLMSFHNQATKRGQGSTALMVLPPGLGKTIIAGSFIKKLTSVQPGRFKVVYVVQSKEILDEATQKLQTLLDIPADRVLRSYGENSGAPIFQGNKNLVAITRTGFFNNLAEFESERRKFEGQVYYVIDEAHHAGKEQGEFSNILSAVKSALKSGDSLIGLTATPWHIESDLIESVFENNVATAFLSEKEKQEYLDSRRLILMARMMLFRAIARGYLSPIMNYRQVRYLDGELPILARDFLNDWDKKFENLNTAERLRMIKTEVRIHVPLIKKMLAEIQATQIVDDKKQVISANRGIIFVPSIAHADVYAALLSLTARNLGLSIEAKAYHSGLSDELRTQAMDWYKDLDKTEARSRTFTPEVRIEKPKHKYLVAIRTIGEGLDDPRTNHLILAKSYSDRDEIGMRELLQNLGRGSRLAYPKPSFTVSDFTGDMRRLIFDQLDKTLVDQVFVTGGTQDFEPLPKPVIRMPTLEIKETVLDIERLKESAFKSEVTNVPVGDLSQGNTPATQSAQPDAEPVREPVAVPVVEPVPPLSQAAIDLLKPISWRSFFSSPIAWEMIRFDEDLNRIINALIGNKISIHDLARATDIMEVPGAANGGWNDLTSLLARLRIHYGTLLESDDPSPYTGAHVLLAGAEILRQVNSNSHFNQLRRSFRGFDGTRLMNLGTSAAKGQLVDYVFGSPRSGNLGDWQEITELVYGIALKSLTPSDQRMIIEYLRKNGPPSLLGPIKRDLPKTISPPVPYFGSIPFATFIRYPGSANLLTRLPTNRQLPSGSSMQSIPYALRGATIEELINTRSFENIKAFARPELRVHLDEVRKLAMAWSKAHHSLDVEAAFVADIYAAELVGIDYSRQTPISSLSGTRYNEARSLLLERFGLELPSENSPLTGWFKREKANLSPTEFHEGYFEKEDGSNNGVLPITLKEFLTETFLTGGISRFNRKRIIDHIFDGTIDPLYLETVGWTPSRLNKTGLYHGLSVFRRTGQFPEELRPLLQRKFYANHPSEWTRVLSSANLNQPELNWEQKRTWREILALPSFIAMVTETSSKDSRHLFSLSDYALTKSRPNQVTDSILRSLGIYLDAKVPHPLMNSDQISGFSYGDLVPQSMHYQVAGILGYASSLEDKYSESFAQQTKDSIKLLRKILVENASEPQFSSLIRVDEKLFKIPNRDDYIQNREHFVQLALQLSNPPDEIWSRVLLRMQSAETRTWAKDEPLVSRYVYWLSNESKLWDIKKIDLLRLNMPNAKISTIDALLSDNESTREIAQRRAYKLMQPLNFPEKISRSEAQLIKERMASDPPQKFLELLRTDPSYVPNVHVQLARFLVDPEVALEVIVEKHGRSFLNPLLGYSRMPAIWKYLVEDEAVKDLKNDVKELLEKFFIKMNWVGAKFYRSSFYDALIKAEEAGDLELRENESPEQLAERLAKKHSWAAQMIDLTDRESWLRAVDNCASLLHK